jgi:hypothetical protein
VRVEYQIVAEENDAVSLNPATVGVERDGHCQIANASRAPTCYLSRLAASKPAVVLPCV